MATAGKITINLEANVARLQADMQKASGVMTRAENTFKQAGKAIGSAFAAAFSVQAIASMAAFSAETERLRSRFQSLVGSAEGAESAMTAIDQTANRLGTNADNLKESFLAFAGAAKGSGLAIDQVDSLFNSLAQSMTQSGYSANEIKSSFDSLQKMFLKGTIAGKDLRSEVFQQMPQALDALAQSFGMTNQQFIELIDSSDVLASQLLPELAAAMADLSKNSSIDPAIKEFERFKNTLDDIQETAVKMFNVFAIGAKEIASTIATISKATGFTSGVQEISKAITGPSQNVQTQDELTKSMLLNESKAQEERKAQKIIENKAKIPSIFRPKKSSITGSSSGSASQAESEEIKNQRNQLELAGEIMREMDRLYQDHERNVATQTERVKRSIETPKQALDAYLKEINLLRDEGRLTFEQHAEAVKNAADNVYGSITSQKSIMEENINLMQSWGQKFTDTFVDGIMKGKFAFKDFANSILQDMLRISIQRSITEPLMNSLLGSSKTGSTGLFSGLFGGKREAGGPVSSGKTYLVGERGPELFTPSGSGSITPNSKIGGNVNVSVSVINNSKSNVSVSEQSTSDGGKSIMIAINEMVQEAIRKGSFDRTMQNTYGLSRRGR